MKSSQTFDIEIIDPCLTTSIELTLENMEVFVALGGIEQQLFASDSVSNTYGANSCGQYSYEIVTDLSALTILSDKLTLVSTDLAEVTISPFIVTIRATMVDYTSKTIEESFDADIKHTCQSSALNF